MHILTEIDYSCYFIMFHRQLLEYFVLLQFRFPKTLLFSFPCPLYQNVPLSLALSPRIFSEVNKFKPDIIHATSPGIMVIIACPSPKVLCSFQCFHLAYHFMWLQVLGALAISKMISVPMVMSYHTHLPAWVPCWNDILLMHHEFVCMYDLTRYGWDVSYVWSSDQLWKFNYTLFA